MAYTDPTVADFQAFFTRDFPYGSDPTTVQAADITNALVMQQNTINQLLFPSQNLYTSGALYLAAHWLVLQLRASSQGIAGRFEWLEQSKGVGPVSSGFGLPPRLLENPQFAWLVSTNYGTYYLMLVLPFLTGNMFVVRGATAGGAVDGLFSGPFGAVGPWPLAGD